eukprot:scaffold15240_cov128-Isochrysis_galbana.AAC.5
MYHGGLEGAARDKGRDQTRASCKHKAWDVGLRLLPVGRQWVVGGGCAPVPCAPPGGVTESTLPKTKCKIEKSEKWYTEYMRRRKKPMWIGSRMASIN